MFILLSKFCSGRVKNKLNTFADDHPYSESGQVLVIMVFVMVIALALGVSMSNKFLSGTRNITNATLGLRAQGVAEAGIENILLKTNDELYDYIQYNSCGDSCIVSWTNADGLVETATITLSTLGSSSDAYIFQISQNEVEEINLNGYPEDTSLTLCWDDDFSEYTSVYAELLSGTVGSYTLTPLAYNSINYGGNSNGFDSASSQLGYDSCFDVNSGSDPLSLRIRIFGSDATIAIIPSSSTDLPAQGVLIESVGEVAGTYKKVAVIRKDAFMGPEFSYVLFSTSENSPLSN